VYSGYGTAGFDPEMIKPTTSEPVDFTQFWMEAKKELAGIPMDVRMTLLPERCTEKVEVYHVNFQNFPENARVYGILCVPKDEGKYPAVLRVPGAGIRPYFGDVYTAEKGAITLQIGIHGIPVIMEDHVYDDLRYGALRNYNTINLEDKNNYYYKRVYLGCVRAIDFIFSLDKFDGFSLAVAGGSQGGALSIVTAGLDDRVQWIVPYYPALCDLTGYLYGRAGGWPHMFKNSNPEDPVVMEEIETSKYYDVVNFARYVQAEGYYSWGFNDNVCPPTSMYAAYNLIDVEKHLFLAPETGHWTYPEQHEVTDAWLYEKLGLE
jgi:cephalosporin-C deacetylase-like acetyl esterase